MAIELFTLLLRFFKNFSKEITISPKIVTEDFPKDLISFCGKDRTLVTLFFPVF